MREYPYEFELKKPVQFYPEPVDDLSADALEIGPGRGDFLLEIAARYPDRKFIAIELSQKRFRKLIPRIEKKGLTNILLIRGNARVIVPEYLASARFRKVYVFFPDPWPKKRHYLHRLLSPDFLRQLTGILVPGGFLFAATDFRPYAEWIVANMNGMKEFSSEGGSDYVTADRIDDYQETFFEQKWRNEGREIYYLRYRRL